jgi:cytochrome c oxidase subunit II
MTPRVLVLILVIVLAGCGGQKTQSALHPTGVQASRIHSVWLHMLWICSGVYAVLIGVILVGAFRRYYERGDHPETNLPAAREARHGAVVVGAVVLSSALLFYLLLDDFFTGRAVDALYDPEALTIRVTAKQWWWEVRYEDPQPHHIVTTANEIHVPVGRTVHIELNSSDVIHSFWAPNLHGKTDVLPGRTTHTFIRADKPGTYWGQCAEFCGYQHANMRFLVVAEREEDFQKWLAHQRKPSREPTNERQHRGRHLFQTRSCVLCHTINGTSANGRVGPDLTHVASRQRIAAGTLPFSRGHLAGWVMDAPSIKPGTRMPTNPITSEELHPLLDYLESLQ